MKIQLYDPRLYYLLTEDWTFEVPKDVWTHHLVKAFYPFTESDARRKAVDKGLSVTIPKGTVLQFRGFNLSKARGLDKVMGVAIVVSPLSNLNSKKWGGTYDYGVHFYIHANMLNDLPEVEPVDPKDFKR